MEMKYILHQSPFKKIV